VTLPLENADRDRYAGQLLTDIVMKVAGNACARRFLRVDEAPRKLTAALVAPPESRVARTRDRLGMTSSVVLEQQSTDEDGLEDHQGNRHGNLPAMPFPGGRYPESHDGCLRKPRRLDAPTLYLAPVERG
jgi:hypothetical protein